MKEGGELSCMFYVFFFATPRSDLIWGDSLDCFDGTAVSLGSEPSSPLPIKFVRSPQMLNTTSQSKYMRSHPRQRAGSTRPLWLLRFPFLHLCQSREPASIITSFLMTSHSMVVPWRSLLHQTLIHSRTLLMARRLATAVSHTAHMCLSRR